MWRKGVLFCLYVVFAMGVGRGLFAQHFAQITDREQIEFAVDLLRKGIQQEDTLQIERILAPSVVLDEQRVAGRDEVIGEFRSIFMNSSQRGKILAPAAASRGHSRLDASHLWDFDITNAAVTIKGDTGFVDCTFVLWGARPEPGKPGPGRKQTGRLVFTVREKKQPEAVDDGEVIVWPKGATQGRPELRGWELVRTKELLDFLESCIEGKVGKPETGQEGGEQ